MNINYLIHNTLWVPGHFHLTVGTAFALTAMALSYWLYPQISGKRLRLRGLAVVQPFVWFVGMALMSNAMHRAGLAGIPRRTAEPQYDQVSFEGVAGTVSEMRLQIAIGGTLLFVALLLFLAVMTATWLSGRDLPVLASDVDRPPLSGATAGPLVLDNLRLWTIIAAVLIVIAYSLPLLGMVSGGVFSPGSPPIAPA
jgi:cytochrome c oxidase subunit 1